MEEDEVTSVATFGGGTSFDLEAPPAPRRKRRLRPKRRLEPAEAPKEAEWLAKFLEGQREEFEQAKQRLEVLLDEEFQRLKASLEGALRADRRESADFAEQLEEHRVRVMDAAWSPAQVALPSPAPQPPELHCVERRGFRAAAGLLTLLCMLVIWLQSDPAVTGDTWPQVSYALNWLCTLGLSGELLLRVKLSGCGQRLWCAYDALVVLLAWADQICLVAWPSGLAALRGARLLVVARLFRLSEGLGGWAETLWEAFGVILGSAAVLALQLYTVAICLTVGCVAWVEQQVGDMWPELLEKETLVMEDPSRTRLVMNVWAWFGSPARVCYTLLCSWGSWWSQSDALLEVGYGMLCIYWVYLLSIVLAVLPVCLGLVVHAVQSSRWTCASGVSP